MMMKRRDEEDEEEDEDDEGEPMSLIICLNGWDRDFPI